MKKLSYPDAIERVMQDNGGYAPLSVLYREVWEHKDRKKIRDKDPSATIRGRVQTSPRFVKIGLGVYALKSSRNAGDLPVESPAQTPKERRHTTMQGMLIEIGNNTDGVVGTYVPAPDRNKVFQNKKLGNIATLDEMPEFTYPKVIESAKLADVIWFDQLGYPSHVYEVEDTGNFRGALIRFCELQNFRAKFYCIASTDPKREEKYKREIGRAAFRAVVDFCQFRTFDDVEADYETRMRTSRL